MNHTFNQDIKCRATGLVDEAHRHSASNRNLTTSLLDYYSSFYIVGYYLLSFDLLYVYLVTTGSTAFYYYYYTNGHALAAKLTFTLVAVAVVFPLSFLISQAYATRQQVLSMFADVQSLVTNICIAQKHWDWDFGKGRSEHLSLTFNSRVRVVMLEYILILQTLLLLPQINRGRYLVTAVGDTYRAEVMSVVDEVRNCLTPNLIKLHLLVEELKAAGLPGNEAARLNQYHYFLTKQTFAMLNHKDYRTPLATRSYSRVYILILPIFLGPYYSWVAIDSNGVEQTNFAYALSLSLFSSTVLVGLFAVQQSLEDPFLSTFESINIAADLDRLTVAVNDIFADEAKAGGEEE
jgi:hypothetical protein